MGHAEQLALVLALAVLLGASRLLGEAARRLGQPSVLGEILAGVLLGPTLLGACWPEAWTYLFAPGTPQATALSGITIFAVALFMLVSGIDMDLGPVLKRSGRSLAVSIGGTAIPFLAGFAVAWLAPDLMGAAADADRLVFALFTGTAMAITALPVIAKTLRDLHLYRTDLGMIVMSSATVSDLLGWGLFAVVLAMAGAGSAEHGPGLGQGLLLAAAFIAGMLTVGRWLIHRTLPWVQAYLSWPGGVLGMIGVLALLCAAFATWVGLHPTLGAFIAGVALGDSRHLRANTRDTLDQAVSFLLVPLFFATIGLRVDFLAHFDVVLVLVVLVVACAGKIGGAMLGARLAGSPSREAAAIGVCMNSRGAMEIILATVALEAGLIGDRLFVALVVMAIVTSLMPGPLLGRILARTTRRAVASYLGSRAVLPDMPARDITAAITALCAAAGRPDAVGAVLAREDLQPTGTAGRVALPHAAVPGLTQPAIAIGLSQDGIDFRAPDGQTARIIVLVLTPPDDDAAQLDLLAELDGLLVRPGVRDEVLRLRTATEFKALIQITRHTAT
jgi:Kef-type K+ transport system membrane component KefB/mannitol/fructose-specific phosphotransferase system IIA component (Ntr-type)